MLANYGTVASSQAPSKDFNRKISIALVTLAGVAIISACVVMTHTTRTALAETYAWKDEAGADNMHNVFDSLTSAGDYSWADEAGEDNAHNVFGNLDKDGEYSWADEAGEDNAHNVFGGLTRGGEYSWADKAGEDNMHNVFDSLPTDGS